MKKLITFLLTIIFITSITACSESPDQLYGIYKDINEKRDQEGYIYTFEIKENQIGQYAIEKPYKKDNSWFINSSVTKKPFIEFKIIDEKTIEYIRLGKPNENLGKWVKITDEEYQHIKNNPAKPEVKPFPKLF